MTTHEITAPLSRAWLARLCSLAVAGSLGCTADVGRFSPPVDYEVTRAHEVFDNGLEVVVVPDGRTPVVTAITTLRAGAFVEDPDTNGYSHLLEHMLFKGSAQIPDPEAFRDELRSLGAVTNATTGVDRVNFFYTLPRDNLEAGLGLMADSLAFPELDEQALAQEVDVVLAEFDLNDSDWESVQDRRLIELLFDRHPSRKNPLGERSVVERATRRALRDMHDRFYVPNNALLVLAGDVTEHDGRAALPARPTLRRGAAHGTGRHRCGSPRRRLAEAQPVTERTPRIVFLLGLLLAGCSSDADAGLPDLLFGSQESECEADAPCINAATKEFDVDGLHVIHRRTSSGALVAATVWSDWGASAWSATGGHAEMMAMQVVNWDGGGPLAGPRFDQGLASIGANFWGWAGADFARFSLEVPVSTFAPGFALLTDALAAPAFEVQPETRLEHVRGLQTQRFAPADEPRDAASRAAWALLFGGHPYNVLTESSDRIPDVDGGDMSRAWRELRRKERITVIVVGDLDREPIRRAVAPLAAALEAGGDAAPTFPAPSPSDDRGVVLDYPEASGWHVAGYFPAPSMNDADHAPLLLGLEALDDLLFEELRTRRGLVYTVGAKLYEQRSNYGAFWLSTAFPADALEAFHALVDEVQVDAIDADTLDAARAQYATNFYHGNQTGAEIAWTLGGWELVAGDRRLADAHLKALDEVTPEDVRDALARYLPGVRYAAAGAGDELTLDALVGAAAR